MEETDFVRKGLKNEVQDGRTTHRGKEEGAPESRSDEELGGKS